MARIIEERHVFTPEQLVEMAMSHAKLAIVGDFYVGDFHEQTVECRPDGSMVVVTRHTPGLLPQFRLEPPPRRTGGR